jgi:hypothetical protein
VRLTRDDIEGSAFVNKSKFLPPKGLLCNYKLSVSNLVSSGNAKDNYLKNLSDNIFPGRTNLRKESVLPSAYK